MAEKSKGFGGPPAGKAEAAAEAEAGLLGEPEAASDCGADLPAFSSTKFTD